MVVLSLEPRELVCKKTRGGKTKKERRGREGATGDAENIALSPPSTISLPFFTSIAAPLSPRIAPFSTIPIPSKRLTTQMSPVLAEKRAPKHPFSSRCKGGGMPPPPQRETCKSNRDVFSLPLFFSQSQYFLCKKCRVVAAFARRSLPLVCHLWELGKSTKKKKKPTLLQEKKTNASKKKSDAPS